ncbi:hypothetical protein CLV93_101304 [Prolixibacter denitrificans]|uniref:Uncharacterized protein n=1 Tax=Prolixibacter denitrificans TaxID=1541063 RepID=A0A2P8CK53_9BACT|nr:hypothetical protein CLV93_101304 [Prolixibacter denitrificans]
MIYQIPKARSHAFSGLVLPCKYVKNKNYACLKNELFFFDNEDVFVFLFHQVLLAGKLFKVLRICL